MQAARIAHAFHAMHAEAPHRVGNPNGRANPPEPNPVSEGAAGGGQEFGISGQSDTCKFFVAVTEVATSGEPDATANAAPSELDPSR